MTSLPGYLAPHAEQLANLHRSVSLRRFLAATGQDEPLADGGHGDDADDYARYPQLTDGRLLGAALQAGDRYHANYLALQYFRVALREPTARLRQVQASTTAELDGRPRTHSELLAAARSCRTNDERARVREALAAVAGRLRDERLRWLDAYASARGRLGFASHRALVRSLDPDVDTWAEHAATWLADTRSEFLQQWRHWRDRDGIAEPRLRDVLAAGSADLPDGVDGRTVVADTLDTWGFAAQRASIAADLQSRPGKVPFAFCTPVDPPTDIRISATRPRTLGDLATLLHEYGHGLHFATLSSVADLWGLAPAPMEAIGLTVELVATRPDWQARHLCRDPDPTALDRLVFRRSAIRRLVAASLVFELAVHDGSLDPDHAYATIFGTEFDVVTDPADTYTRLQAYLEGQPCYPLVYTRAYTAAEDMWDHLIVAGGLRWYLEPEAAAALRALFAIVSGGGIPQVRR
jgi:hypothetical protein